jgi:hypothetical protein
LRPAASRLLLISVLAFSACSKCGGEKTVAGPPGAPPAGILRRIPQGTRGVVIAPDALELGEAMQVVQGLKAASFFAALQGFSSAQEYGDALIRQMGIDVRSAAALEKAGVDSKKGLAVVMSQSGDAWLILGAEQPTRVGATLRTLATERLGAGVYEKKDVGGVELHTLARAQGMPPRMGYVVVDGYVLVAADEQVAKLVDWAKLPAEQSLASDKGFTDATARLPKERHLIGWVPPGSPALSGTPITQVAGTAWLDPRGLKVTVDIPANEALNAAAFVKAEGANLLPLLPADGFLVARYGAEPKVLSNLLKKAMGGRLLDALTERGVDVDAQLLGNLKPGGAFALSVSPRAQLGRGMPDLDVQRTNPFSFVQLAGALEAKDESKVQETLKKIAEAGPRFGAQVKPVENKDGLLLFASSYQAGEGVHFGADKARVAFGNPIERVEAVLKADGKGEGPVADAELKKVLERPAALVVDLRKLAGQVQALPSESWGVGGFAIKASTLRWLDATDDLLAFTVSAESKGQFVQSEVTLSLKPPAPAEKAP